MVAVLGGALALTGEVWETAAAREREAQLLFVGNQYRRAIERYYLSGPQRQYPQTLEDLLKDTRMPSTERYLRAIYPDPITNKEIGLIKAPGGSIVGVYSLSEDKPFKASGFHPRDAAFEGAKSYAEWKFIHNQPAPAAATKPQPGSAPAPAPGQATPGRAPSSPSGFQPPPLGGADPEQAPPDH